MFSQMTVCAKQSVMLHKEAVDNLHSVVDANVKVHTTLYITVPVLKAGHPGVPSVCPCLFLWNAGI